MMITLALSLKCWCGTKFAERAQPPDVNLQLTELLTSAEPRITSLYFGVESPGNETSQMDVVERTHLPLVLSTRRPTDKTYHVTIVVNLPQVGVLDLAPTHSINMLTNNCCTCTASRAAAG